MVAHLERRTFPPTEFFNALLYFWPLVQAWFFQLNSHMWTPYLAPSCKFRSLSERGGVFKYGRLTRNSFEGGLSQYWIWDGYWISYHLYHHHLNTGYRAFSLQIKTSPVCFSFAWSQKTDWTECQMWCHPSFRLARNWTITPTRFLRIGDVWMKKVHRSCFKNKNPWKSKMCPVVRFFGFLGDIFLDFFVIFFCISLKIENM